MVRQKISQAVTELQDSVWYALMFVCLAITSLVLLGYEVSPYAQPEIVSIAIRVDLAIACIFLCDFLLGLFFNLKYTKREYWRTNWLDFISSIPLTADAVRVLRIFRVWRAIRIISTAIHFYISRRQYRSLKEQ